MNYNHICNTICNYKWKITYYYGNKKNGTSNDEKDIKEQVAAIARRASTLCIVYQLCSFLDCESLLCHSCPHFPIILLQCTMRVVVLEKHLETSADAKCSVMGDFGTRDLFSMVTIIFQVLVLVIQVF